jgi:hypothetical protein
MKNRIKNWNKFQHFSNRKPIWIKLYRDLLDNPDWFDLDGDTAKILIGLWLIASENEGFLPDTKTLSFRLRTTQAKAEQALTKLENFLEPVENSDDVNMMPANEESDINMTSSRHQVDATEKRREEKEERREREREEDGKPTVLPSHDSFQPEIIFITRGRPKTWTLTNAFLTKAKGIYPNIDLITQIRLAKVWTESEDHHKKTAKGMETFLLNWFGRCTPAKPQARKQFDADEFLRNKFAEVQS